MKDRDKILARIDFNLLNKAMSCADSAYYYKGIKKTTEEQKKQLVHEWYLYAQKHQIFFDKAFLCMILDVIDKLDKSPPPDLVKKLTGERRNWDKKCEEHSKFCAKIINQDLSRIPFFLDKWEDYMKRLAKYEISLAEYMKIRDKFDFISANYEPWDCKERTRLRYKIGEIERFSIGRCYLRPPLPDYMKSSAEFNAYIS